MLQSSSLKALFAMLFWCKCLTFFPASCFNHDQQRKPFIDQDSQLSPLWQTVKPSENEEKGAKTDKHLFLKIWCCLNINALTKKFELASMPSFLHPLLLSYPPVGHLPWGKLPSFHSAKTRTAVSEANGTSLYIRFTKTRLQNFPSLRQFAIEYSGVKILSGGCIFSIIWPETTSSIQYCLKHYQSLCFFFHCLAIVQKYHPNPSSCWLIPLNAHPLIPQPVTRYPLLALWLYLYNGLLFNFTRASQLIVLSICRRFMAKKEQNAEPADKFLDIRHTKSYRYEATAARQHLLSSIMPRCASGWCRVEEYQVATTLHSYEDSVERTTFR